MKITLPNGKEKILNDHISIEKKLEIVSELSEEFTVITRYNWDGDSVKFFLDSLASYLVWHKEPEDKGTEDKEILSVKKLEKMNRFKKTSKTVNFSDLSRKDAELLFGEYGSNE